MERTCRTCGEGFENTDGRVRYCTKCRLSDGDRKAKALREFRVRRAALRIHLCVECDEPVRPHQLRCPIHWTVRRREQYRRAGQAHNYDICKCGKRKGKAARICKSCDAEFKREQNTGERNPTWKGGRTAHRDGYVQIRNGVGRNVGYTMEHRAVWEAANGPIPDRWVVHHLNGIKSDNHLENLQAMSRSHHGPRAHLDPTVYEKRIRDLEQQVRDLESR